MSKARSPREVCSTTIGISGLISLLLLDLLPAGYPQFLLCRLPFFLAGRPDAASGVRKLLRDRRDVCSDAVDRPSKPEIRADPVGAACVHELLDIFVALALVA